MSGLSIDSESEQRGVPLIVSLDRSTDMHSGGFRNQAVR